IDIFVHDSDESLSASLIKRSPAVNVFSSQSRNGTTGQVEKTARVKEAKNKQPSIWRSLWLRCRACLSNLKRRIQLWTYPEWRLIPKYLIQPVIERGKQNSYDALIAIEKGGLIWRGAVAAVTG